MADYAISNVSRRVVYAASGTGPYAFTFEILAAGDIAVYKGDTLLTLTTDYTVSISSNGTGSVTLVATAGTSNITIVGSKTIARTTDFTTGGDFFANTLNDELDAQTIFIQQIAETAERGMKAPVTDPTDINMTLPRKADRAGKYLAFDADGNPEPGPTSSDVSGVAAIADEVVTVAGIAANVTTVANNDANVTTVATNIGSVNTVAASIANVNTTATNIANVNAVGADLLEAVSEINTVATSIANVDAVGGNISNVNSVAGNATNINSVASNSTNINTVATNIANVNATGANIANVNAVGSDLLEPTSEINTVATDITNVNTVGTNIASVNTVAGISANVTTVAGISANVTTVAGNTTNINTVAGVSGNVTTVAGISSSVTAVASNASNINQVAADTVAINSASANATAAAASALSASGSATSASASAAAASAVALGNEPVRHSVRPSLLLDFANTKTLDPRITFTRGSTGTFYDGKTVAKAEENLYQQSQTFDDSYWAKTDVTITANSEVAPDGTSTAETLTDNATSALHSVGRSTTLNGSSATFSIYAKAGTANFLLVRGSDSTTTRYAWFNLSTGAVGTVQTNITASIQSVGNGWYRCIATFAATPTSASTAYFGMSTSDNVSNYSGTGSTIHIWGAQLEQRSSVTAYTATTTAPITNYIPALQTAASGVARFEHNPTTGESLGLEIEEQRTNLLTYSEQFDNAAWAGTSTTRVSNVVISPDGTLTADKYILPDTITSSGSAVYQSVSKSASAITYTYSSYCKAGEFNTVRLYVRDPASSSNASAAYFNLSTGTVSNTSATGTFTSASSTITPVGNSWYKCTLTFTSGTETSLSVRYYLYNDGTTSVTGNGYSGLYIWGAQLEAGSFATSYIPTVASQVTRSSDAASMTGTNFSSWYRADEGTVYGEASTYDVSVARASFGINDATSANRIQTSHGGGSKGFIAKNSVTQLSQAIAVTFTNNTSSKVSLSYANNNGVACANGTIGTDDTLLEVPIVNQLELGKSVTTASILNGTIKKLAYYPRRLTNAELVSLSTV